jgi:hypothetical protein
MAAAQLKNKQGQGSERSRDSFESVDFQ